MAITEMDSVTQQNAALVEEAAAAAGSLEEQSTALAQLVSRFTVYVATAAPMRAARVISHTMAPRVTIKGPVKAVAVPARPAASRAAPKISVKEWETF
jgi:hypothetical protein